MALCQDLRMASGMLGLPPRPLDTTVHRAREPLLWRLSFSLARSGPHIRPYDTLEKALPLHASGPLPYLMTSRLGAAGLTADQ